jgi:hypothetical protein
MVCFATSTGGPSFASYLEEVHDEEQVDDGLHIHEVNAFGTRTTTRAVPLLRIRDLRKCNQREQHDTDHEDPILKRHAWGLRQEHAIEHGTEPHSTHFDRSSAVRLEPLVQVAGLELALLDPQTFGRHRS